MRRLRGAEAPDPHEQHLAVLGPALAAGTTAGANPDPRAHLDPNEDAALIARSDDVTVMAVFDGNGGFAAADAASAAVAGGVARSPAVTGAGVDGLMELGRAAAARARDGGRGRYHATGVSFSVAVLGPTGLLVRSLGDTGVVLVGRRIEAVSGVVPHLSHPSPVPPQRHVISLDGVRAVLLATDGVFDALGPAWTVAARKAVESGDPGAVVQAILHACLAKQADDNCTIAVNLRGID